MGKTRRGQTGYIGLPKLLKNKATVNVSVADTQIYTKVSIYIILQVYIELLGGVCHLFYL